MFRKIYILVFGFFIIIFIVMGIIVRVIVIVRVIMIVIVIILSSIIILVVFLYYFITLYDINLFNSIFLLLMYSSARFILLFSCFLVISIVNYSFLSIFLFLFISRFSWIWIDCQIYQILSKIKIDFIMNFMIWIEMNLN